MNGCTRSIFFLLTLTAFSLDVLATHKSDEVYDGTTDSVRWLKKPISVNHVTVKDERGEKVGISKFNGKVVLLNLWASWCEPCITELPALDRLQNRLGGNEFVTLAVSIDDNIDEARNVFSGRLQIKSLDFYRESAEILQHDFPVDVIPASFIIDRKGQAIGLLRSNINWDEPKTDKLFNRLISGSTAPAHSSDKELTGQVQ